jgi:hypothetical protein
MKRNGGGSGGITSPFLTSALDIGEWSASHAVEYTLYYYPPAHTEVVEWFIT